MLDKKRPAWMSKVLFFILFGVSAGAIYTGSYLLLVSYMELSVLASSMLAYAVSIPVSYFGNRVKTFQSQNAVPEEMMRFLVVQVANMCLTSLVVQISHSWIQYPARYGALVAVCIAPVISFVLYDTWVYKPRRLKTRQARD